MNRIAALLIAALFALLFFAGLAVLLGAGFIGGMLFLLGLPLAFPLSSTLVLLCLSALAIRAMIHHRRHQRKKRLIRDVLAPPADPGDGNRHSRSGNDTSLRP